MSEKTEKNFYEKLADLQAENVDLPKNKKAYGYNYCPLDTIMDKIRPLLKKHGLVLYSIVGNDENGKLQLTTTLACVDNEGFIESKSTIDQHKLQGQNEYQVQGSAITYYRRYHISAMLQLTSEEDTDVSSVKTKNTKPATEQTNESGEKTIDFVAIFSNMIDKKKPKATIMKQFEVYKPKMLKEDIEKIKELIDKIE